MSDNSCVTMLEGGRLHVLTLVELLLEATTSGAPSSLRSTTAAFHGLPALVMVTAESNVPSPRLSTREEPADACAVTTTSGKPSPLMSPMAMSVPKTVYEDWLPNVPLPAPMRVYS